MNIAFSKMHGAGNDFILVDDREETFPSHDKAWMSRVGARRTGVGCDGFILVQSSTTADFRMRFFNPDGGEAEMCGNGARCVARFAHDIGLIGSSMTIETLAGQLQAQVLPDDRVRLQLTDPSDWRMDVALELEGEPVVVHAVDTGVPHAVTEVDDLEGMDVARAGASLRYHTAFAPAGTNVDFIRVDGPSQLTLRTYERGVEGETLACGTGMVAATLVAARLGRVHAPVSVTCAAGDVLEVSFQGKGEELRQVTLTGPAVHVFNGTLPYGDGSRDGRFTA